MRSSRLVFVVSLLFAFILCSCKRGEQTNTETGKRAASKITEADPGKKAKLQNAKPQLHMIYGSLLVNEARVQTLSDQMPVIVTAVITNPHRKQVEILQPFYSLEPMVREANGKKKECRWKLVGRRPREIAPGGSVQVHWHLENSLEVGEYQVVLTPEASCLQAEVAIGAVRLSSAKLTISDQAYDPGWVAVFERRLEMLQQDPAKMAISLVQQLKEDPDNHPMRVDLVDVLEAMGEWAAAEFQLQILASQIHKQIETDPSKKGLVVPEWVYLRMAEINRRKQAAEPAGK